MRTRTRLTSPPGQAPLADDSATETYSAGFALPVEPRVPGRSRRALLVVAVVVTVLAGSIAAWQLATRTQQQDPALSEVDL